MRILIAHNRYRHPGGEDAVAENERDLLRRYGHEVRYYERSNSELDGLSPLRTLRFFADMRWSRESYDAMRRVIADFRPEVAHFHNIFFMLSPSVYAACRDEGVPVVQSQHNFRLLCSNALFLRDGRICEECREHKSLRRGVRYGCYKNSRLLTFVMVRMLEDHWKRGTWTRMVDAYIMATEFGRQKYAAAGVPAEKIFVKPHVAFTSGEAKSEDRGYALFAGRLSEEKGIRILLQAWASIPDLTLKVVGQGPLFDEMKAFVRQNDLEHVEFRGFLSPVEYDATLRGAKLMIVPSVCYENFPRTVAEAFACQVPLAVSRLGGMPELVKEGETGFLFEPAAESLAAKVRWIMRNEHVLPGIRENMKTHYERELSPDKNHERLMEVYAYALRESKRRQSVASD